MKMQLSFENLVFLFAIKPCFTFRVSSILSVTSGSLDLKVNFCHRDCIHSQARNIQNHDYSCVVLVNCHARSLPETYTE
ncbi:hypothetical protein A0H81_05556 [Grifola frondosa]|uniref:Secreted protein n=1 Tax=Grifola frondosa TaxID=5627 RepID=A0A1C7MCI9_GRIFR|nr:hypothetical protein A0H81_05556 [Grifola frondosa]